MLNDVCLLIAHNLTFDINVLLTEAKRNNNMELYDKLLTIPKFDTMRYAGSLGLKLINRPFPSQEDVYNLIFYNQQPKSKSRKSKVQALTFDEMDGKQEDKQERLLMFSRTVSNLQAKAREQKYKERLNHMESQTMVMLVATGAGVMVLILISMLYMFSGI